MNASTPPGGAGPADPSSLSQINRRGHPRPSQAAQPRPPSRSRGPRQVIRHRNEPPSRPGSITRHRQQAAAAASSTRIFLAREPQITLRRRRLASAWSGPGRISPAAAAAAPRHVLPRQPRLQAAWPTRSSQHSPAGSGLVLQQSPHPASRAPAQRRLAHPPLITLFCTFPLRSMVSALITVI